MMKQTVRLTLLLLMAFVIAAPPCWAKAKGYLYVISYSFTQKKIFLSPIIIQNVRDISYSDEEYVTEVELIQKMEAQFQQHMASAAGANPSDYTTSVKGAYKSKAIADMKMKKERERYLKKGYSAKVLSSFAYQD